MVGWLHYNEPGSDNDFSKVMRKIMTGVGPFRDCALSAHPRRCTCSSMAVLLKVHNVHNQHYQAGTKCANTRVPAWLSHSPMPGTCTLSAKEKISTVWKLKGAEEPMRSLTTGEEELSFSSC